MQVVFFKTSKTFCLASVAIICIALQSNAQVKIGGLPGPPVSSAVLELDGGGTKALRLPIVSSKEQLADLPNPVNGLMVYGSHTGSVYYHHQSSWYELKSPEPGFELPHTGSYAVNNGTILQLTNTGINGNGIQGISTNATGVMGSSGTGVGIKAQATSGIAFEAESQTGTSALIKHPSTIGKALIVEQGRVGIGTTNPLTNLHIRGGFLLLGGESQAILKGGLPIQEWTGRIMTFGHSTGAFRVGNADGTILNDDNVGYMSMGLGFQVLAKGNHSVAMGSLANAENDFSTAIGRRTVAGGQGAASIGYFLSTSSLGEVALGMYNEPYFPLAGGETNFNASDRLFVLGNGSSENARSNAMVVLKSGNIGIGTNTPGHRLVVNGDFSLTGRLRANGNGGSNGQVLTSTGTGITWSSIVAQPQTSYRGMLNDLVIIPASGNSYLNLSRITGFGNFNEGGGSYNQTLAEYTIPAAGVYDINVSAAFTTSSSTNGSVSMFVEVNNSTPANPVVAMDQRWLVSPHSNSVDVLHASVITRLPANARIKVRIVNDTNGNVVVTDGDSFPTFLSAARVY